MNEKSTRRDFLKESTALGLGAAWWAGTQSAWAKEKSPAERLNFACIGVGGKGSSDTDSAGRYGNVVAICDIDANRLDAKAKRFPKAKKYFDYRKMLEELDSEIDAVTVSTPDHSHAPASIQAMKMGKHCFTQKPLTWSVYEARLMREVAAQQGVATQMGNQGTAERLLREAVEMLRAGVIGQVKEVHVWTNRPVWPQGQGRPEPEEVPDHVHWNEWLGPAPERPYSSAYHPFKWRGWLDFGTGALGDMACHTMNLPVMGVDLFDPVAVKAEHSGIVADETYPKWSVIRYEFGPRGNWDPCTMTWYDGGKRPPEKLGLGEVKLPERGSLLVGTEGTMISVGDYGGQETILLPKEKFANYKKPEPSLPRSPGHFKEFAEACKGGSPAMSNFDYASRLTETVLLGNVALLAGQRVEWDAANMKVKSPSEANEFLHRRYRDGWRL